MISIAKVTDVADPSAPRAARPGESAVECVALDHYTLAVDDWVAVAVEGGNWTIIGKVVV